MTVDHQGITHLIVRDSYGGDSLNGIFYMFGGYSAGGIRNSLLSLDLSQDPLRWQFLSTDFTSPSERKLHSLNTLKGKIYMFGGERDYIKLDEL